MTKKGHGAAMVGGAIYKGAEASGDKITDEKANLYAKSAIWNQVKAGA